MPAMPSPIPTTIIANGSQVRSARLVFAYPTVLDPAALAIRPTAKPVAVTSGKAPTPKSSVPLTILPQADGKTYLIGFDLRGFDGVYDLVLSLGGVAVTLRTFHQLFADFDGNGTVNDSGTDYAKIGASLDKPAGDAGFQPSLDFNDDGYVDATDVYRPGGVNDTLTATPATGTAWVY